MKYHELKELVYIYYPRNVYFGESEYMESKSYNKLVNLCLKPPYQENFNLLQRKLKDTYGEKNVRNFSLLHDANPSYILRILYRKEDQLYSYLVINISIVIPNYICYISDLDASTNKSSQSFILDSKEYTDIENTIEKELRFFFPKYEQLPVEIAFLKVPEISLGRKHFGEVSFFDCLFTDHIW